MPLKVRLAFVVGLAAMFVAGVAAWLYPSIYPSGAPQNVSAPPAAPVTTATPIRREVTDWREFTGQFAPVDYVEVRSMVGGYLTEIHFTDGRLVRDGDLLFVIDPRPFEIALAAARARLDQAISSREFAVRQLNRAGELKQHDNVPQSTLDLRLSESRGAGAAVEAARAAVREAELNLQFTRIIAPMTGRAGARQISVGNLVTAGGAGGNTGGGTLLATIVSQDILYFNFDMSETDYLAFRRLRGDATIDGELDVPVRLRLMDEADWMRQGRLTFIDNQVDRASGTIRARATVANPNHFIAPGAFGRVRMPLSAPYEALLAPDASVVTDQNRSILMTVAADGTVVPKPVEIGPLVDGLRVVRSGISPEDRVIVNGLIFARPGAKVTPQPDGAAHQAPAADGKQGE